MKTFKRSNLCENIDFEPLPPKWTRLQLHQEHHEATQKTHTKHCMQRNKIHKTVHKIKKLHKSKKRSNLCENIASARILNSKIGWFCSEMEVDVVSGHNTSTSTGDMLVVCFIVFLMVNLGFGLGWCM